MIRILKKRWFSLLILAALLLLVIWVLFFRPSRHTGSLVPDHAAWYAEADSPQLLLAELEKALLPVSDSGITFVQEMQTALKMAEGVFSDRKELQKTLLESTLGISAHPVSETQTGYIFYLSCRDELHGDVFRQIEGRFRKNPGLRVSTREYLGETILEIGEKKGGTFCLAFVNSVVVGSFSGFLVEDIIRNAGVILKPNFTTRLRQDPRFQQLEACRLKLFVQTAGFPPFFHRFLSAKEPDLISLTASSFVLGLQQKQNGLLNLEGYCLNADQDKLLPGTSVSGLRAMLPDREIVMAFALAKADLWQRIRQKNELSAEEKELFGNALGNEFLMALAEGRGLQKYDHLLMAAIQDEKSLEKLLQSLAGNVQKPYDYQEEYRGFYLYKHRNKQLAQKIAGPVLEGWSAAHYAVIGKNLIISDRMELIRLCADAATGKKSALPEGDISPGRFFLDMAPAQLVPALSEHASGPFRRHLKEWIPLLKAISNFKAYDSGENENPEIALRLQFIVPEKNPDSLTALKELVFDTLFAALPHNPDPAADRNRLILIQDKKKTTHFMDENLRLIGSRAHPDFWQGLPALLRRNHEGGASVLFSFPDRVQICSRYGDPESDFPLRLPDSLGGISKTALLDYDQSLQYRLFVACRYGYVAAADASGKLLPGWNPKKTGSPAALAPRHFRAGGHDYILMVNNEGELLLTNRKGEMQPGFPFRLKGAPVIGWFAETGLDEEGSYIYCLSDLGLMQKVNLKGKQSSFFQLFRPDLDTRFLLCPDQKERTFVLARISRSGLTLFDQSYRPILEHKSGGNRFSVRHFQFGSSGKLYAITNLDTRQCSLYNEAGIPLFKKSFPSDFGVEIFPVPGNSGRYRLISSSGNKLWMSEFSGN